MDSLLSTTGVMISILDIRTSQTLIDTQGLTLSVSRITTKKSFFDLTEISFYDTETKIKTFTYCTVTASLQGNTLRAIILNAFLYVKMYIIKNFEDLT